MFKNSLKISAVAMALTALIAFSCKSKQETTTKDSAKLSVEFEKYELENGLPRLSRRVNDGPRHELLDTSRAKAGSPPSASVRS